MVENLPELESLDNTDRMVVFRDGKPYVAKLHNVATAPGRRQVDIFTTSGTWLKAPWAKEVIVLIRGGGGGGGSGRRGAAGSARSGGQGGYGAISIGGQYIASFLEDTVVVTVGAKGTGGAAVTANDTNGNAGTDGGETRFGSLIRSRGGFGGLGGTNAATALQTAISTIGMGSSLATSVTAALSGLTSQLAGGSGGSVSTGNAALAGANGGPTLAFDPEGLGQGTAGATASNGGNGGVNGETVNTSLLSTTSSNNLSGYNAGGGGGGGGASTNGVTPGGNGGNGGGNGAGGGGGGASTNGSNSGAGGDGTDGICVVIQMG